MKELDAIDTGILKMLLKDGRRSFTDIAGELQTSKDVVCSRYKELKKDGIIVGATIQVNPQKRGYYGIVMILLSVDSQNLEAVWERINQIPGLMTFRYYNSIYNLAAIRKLKTLSDLEHLKQIMNKENKVNQFQTYLWTDIRNIPENILPPSTPTEDEYVPEVFSKDPFEIDQIDEDMIKILEANGRQPFRKIAEQTDTATSTVARRYQELKKNNLIKTCIQINPHKLGFQNILEISLAVADQNEIDEMANKISKIPGVTYMAKISGNYDLSIVCLVKDCKDIVEINNRILRIPNIKRMEGTLRRLPPAWPGRSQCISTF